MLFKELFVEKTDTLKISYEYNELFFDFVGFEVT